MVNSRRKMLAARDDLADKISEIANSKGFTLFGMINNILELAIEAEKMGISLEEAVDNYKVTKAVKEASFILVLESLLYETAEIACEKAKEETLKVWFDAGVWLASQYTSRNIENPLGNIEKDLKAFSWNIPEFTIEQIDDKVSIRVLSPRLSESYTVLFNRFLEGILKALSFEVKYKELGKGNIRLEAARGGG